jgi:hypothetical protein
MGDQRRWAARYQFLEQLWSGRDRIVCDRELEVALHSGVEGPAATLLDALIPGEGGDARAWVALHNDRRAARFSRTHSGTVFTGLDDAPELASDEGWQVALVNLESGETAELEAFLEILGERAEDDPERSVVLTIDSGDDEDARYEELGLIVEELFGDGRIYGLTRPGMAAFYDFGPVLEPEEGEAEDGPVGVEVDNSLGTDEPRFEAFVAVVGARVPGENVTFVELPVFERGAERGERARASAAAASGATRAEQEELAALRVQLAEAQRLGDMQAIERQSLLEQLEQAEDRIAGLDDELQLLREDDEAGEPSAPTGDGPRLDEVLAREQALRWELDRLRGELDNLRARPVDELEAEVASLRAKLDRAQVGLAPTVSDELDADIDGLVDELSEVTLAELAATLDDEPSPARARAWMKARSQLEHLLRKLERGGRLSALELHRELRSLRELL